MGLYLIRDSAWVRPSGKNNFVREICYRFYLLSVSADIVIGAKNGIVNHGAS